MTQATSSPDPHGDPTGSHRMVDFLSTQGSNPVNLTLTPISSKAMNRLANQMAGDPVVVVEQRQGNDLFCVSSNGTWCAWVNCLTDPNWVVRF